MNRVAARLPDEFQTVLLSRIKGCPISATGDVLINGQPTLPIQASRYLVTEIVVSNPLISGVSGTIATGLLGVFTAASAGGTTVAANQALTPTQTTGTTAAQDLTITNAATTVLTAAALYVNVGTSVANATCDISVYGKVLLP